MTQDNLILLAAGGTGGHLFPAQALAHALSARGARVRLATDERALQYGDAFPAEKIHEIASATPTGGSLASKAVAALKLGRGVLQAYALLGDIKPRAVVCFGGYPTVPPALAAALRGVPLILHEQNAVMGRANKFLSKRAKIIASGFPEIAGLPDALRGAGGSCRQSGAPGGDRGGGAALPGVCRQQAAPSRHRRLAGRAHHVGCGSLGYRPAVR